MPSLREAAVAGQFYPGSAAELEATVRQFLDGAGPPETTRVRAGQPLSKRGRLTGPGRFEVSQAVPAWRASSIKLRLDCGM